MTVTDAEARAIAALRRRSVSALYGRDVLKPIATPDGIEAVSMRDLERRGLVEQWPDRFGVTRWTACDQPASFWRPHWWCERRDFGLLIFARVGGVHPLLYASVPIPTHGDIEPTALRYSFEEAVKWMADELRHMRERKVRDAKLEGHDVPKTA